MTPNIKTVGNDGGINVKAFTLGGIGEAKRSYRTGLGISNSK